MEPAAWAEVKRAFALVRESSPEDRPALLAGLAPGVRAEVESLIGSLDVAPRYLAGEEDVPFRSGALVGPYRLLEELGRGGMGTVYLAERADGEIRQQLALKVAAGRIFAPEAERRFIQERQILARLTHPNIVRLLDGGVAAGQRYFVMELVSGTPITSYCHERGLPVTERVELVRQVCAAIHHAHQHLILHRDIKPGNVIVTADGQVKVLDFGIAQIVQAGTLMVDTRTAIHPMSLACASPEQIRGEPLSLASDVYSLGTLLYEVLTGVNPQHRADITVEEALKLVLDHQPPRPGAIAPAVPRDLDAITLKALAKVPADRYASVSELDADLARWTEGRPVLAVPPRPWYVAARFVRRNKALSATAAALVVSLTAGIVAVDRQARIADRRFEDARQLIHTTIFDIQPKLEAIPGTLPLRTTLIEETMKYLEAVSKDAGGNVALLRELSNAYQQLARVQGDISTNTLGNQAAAADRFQKAKVLLDAALAIEPRNPDLLKDAALLLGRIAGFENLRGASDAALAAATAAVSYADRHLAARPGDRDATQVLAGAVFYEALTTPAGQWDVRKHLFERALGLYSDLAAAPTANEAVRRNVGILNRHLAGLNYDRALGAPAVAHARRAGEVSAAILAARPQDTALQIEAAQDAYILGMALDLAGTADEAPAHYGRARGLLDGIRAADPSNVRATLLLGETLRFSAANRLGSRDPAAARQQAAEAIALFASLADQGPLLQAVQWRYASALATAADVERGAANRSAACGLYARSATLFEEADRRSPLTDQVKRDFDRVRSQVAACGPETR